MTMTKMMLSAIVILVVGAMFSCIGYDTARYSSKVTGARKRIHHIYIPFWISPNRALTLYYHEEKFPSAVEWFMKKHGVHESDLAISWNLDGIYVHYQSLWAVSVGDPAYPGRYQLFDSCENEDFLYSFLEEYEKSHPELASEIPVFFQQPKADWVFNWRQNLQLQYYHYLLDVHSGEIDQKEIERRLLIVKSKTQATT